MMKNEEFREFRGKAKSLSYHILTALETASKQLLDLKEELKTLKERAPHIDSASPSVFLSISYIGKNADTEHNRLKKEHMELYGVYP